jgi:hypothetical protein
MAEGWLRVEEGIDAEAVLDMSMKEVAKAEGVAADGEVEVEAELDKVAIDLEADEVIADEVVIPVERVDEGMTVSTTDM